MYKNRSQGFTLIELLVVIAIIGILSAVVLASLNTARTKGTDAALQSDINTIQNQAEIYYGGSGNNSYGPGITTTTASCTSGMFSDPTITNALAGIHSTSGGSSVPICILISNGTNAIDYVAATPSVVTPTNYFCVDSSGLSTTTTTKPSTTSTKCGT